MIGIEKSKKKLTIELLDLDKTTQNTLKFFFKSNLCRSAELNESSEKPDVLILDNERGINDKIIANLAANNQHAVIMHMPNNIPEKSDNVCTLCKPIQAKKLKDIIQSINKDDNQIENSETKILKEPELKPVHSIKNIHSANSHIGMAVKSDTVQSIQNRYKAHKHVGSNADINPNNLKELDKIYHTPSKYIYFHLARATKHAHENKSDVKIKTVYGNVFYEYKTKLFHYGFDKTKLKHIQASPLFAQTDCSYITYDQNKPHRINLSSQDSLSLIWSSAILASKGRVPKGTNLENTVTMKSWPNYSNLMVFRYVIQISSAWSNHQLSLIETAKQLEIPQRYVFTLYNAMHAIECANISDKKIKSQKINRRNQSVLSKILSHMFKKK